jgi:6-phosphofructokinase 1
MNKEYGYMVGIKDGKTVKIPLEDVAGKLKTIPDDCEVIEQAKLLGICFGD